MKRVQGTTLFELLIALLVLAIGVLGFLVAVKKSLEGVYRAEQISLAVVQKPW